MSDMSLNERIYNLRREREWTQEQLAQKLGLSNQAVSKWENAQACPDIALLPTLADLFGVSIDSLFGRENGLMPVPAQGEPGAQEMPWEDDGAFHVAVFRGRKLLSDKQIKELSGKRELGYIRYEGEARDVYCALNLECGDVSGDVQAGGGVTCGDVGGDVQGGGVTCNDVGGDVHGGGVTCGDVGGDVHGGGVTCDDVSGSVQANGDVTCDDVDGDVSAGGDVECGDVDGSVTAQGEVSCGDVNGDVQAGGDVECGDVKGSVTAEGRVAGGDAERRVHVKINAEKGKTVLHVRDDDGEFTLF